MECQTLKLSTENIIKKDQQQWQQKNLTHVLLSQRWKQKKRLLVLLLTSRKQTTRKNAKNCWQD
jgi:hypothetical protein